MKKSADAFRTISEVADWLGTPAHVLRFWESRFSQVKPVKRAGGRRYYRPSDMALLGGLKKLLHEDGMTIKGAQGLLREKGVKYVASLSGPVVAEARQEPDAIEAEAAAPPEKAPAGLPPLSLRGGAIPAKPAPEAADLPPAAAPIADTPAELPAESGTPEGEAPTEDLPFIHRPAEITGGDVTREPFLRSASGALDAQSEAPAITEEPAAGETPPEPQGPPRLAELRTALMAAGGLDRDVLEQVAGRLRDLRARLAEANPGHPNR